MRFFHWPGIRAKKGEGRKMTLLNHKGKVLIGLNDNTPLPIVYYVRKVEARRLGCHPADIDVVYEPDTPAVIPTETWVNYRQFVNLRTL
jgi:hypothetical protein